MESIRKISAFKNVGGVCDGLKQFHDGPKKPSKTAPRATLFLKTETEP